MRLILSDIPEDGLHQEADLQITVGEDAQKEKARVSIDVHKYGKRVTLKGSAEMSSLFACSRCLKEFQLPLRADFEEEYLPAPELNVGEEEPADEELEPGLYRGDEINIEELIREQMLLAVPMKPLCKPDCLGICPKCGRDLNEAVCGCRQEETDSRLMPLKKIKESMKNIERSKNGKSNVKTQQGQKR
jgi:uncharacterized protein